MIPTPIPASKLTADCIWNAFQSSNKCHLILTGARKSGKTTLLSHLCPHTLPGITTWAEPRKAVYLRENTTGKTIQTGIYNHHLPGTENKMQLTPNGFQSLGIEALEHCLQTDSQWISIDEIGYLETKCPEYCDAIRALMARKRLIAVVRKQSLPFLEEICHRDDVFRMDMDAPFGNLGCVIMASGLGQRFGGNKLMADFKGKPLLQWTLDATAGMFQRRIVVTRHKEVKALCLAQGIETILHTLPARNDTVRLGLQAILGMPSAIPENARSIPEDAQAAAEDSPTIPDSIPQAPQPAPAAACASPKTAQAITPAALADITGCLFCPGDQPLLRWDTVASLALNACNEPTSLWRAAHKDTVGSPVLFPKWTFPELLTLPEGKGGSFVLKKYPEQVQKIPVRDKYELMDIDTPEDMAILSKR